VTNGAALGKVIADGFLAQGKAESTSGLTLSVVDNARTDELANALNKFIVDLTVSVRKSGTIKYLPVAKARSEVEEYGKSEKSPEESTDVIDLLDFAKSVKKADPSVAASADALIRALNSAIVYKIKDETRPNANGLSIFLPFNKLENKDGMSQVMNQYNSIPFIQGWQKFVKEYTDIALGDNEKPEIPEGVKEQNNVIEALCTSEDFDEGYVVLIAPDDEDDNVVNFLGVMMPDEMEETDEGVHLKYTWDGKWLGINGEPANIADMYVDEYEDEDGNTFALTIVEISAKINDEYVTLEFTVEEDGSYELTNITPEIEDGLFAKQTFKIQEGDVLTLIYDKYNLETDEEIEGEGASFTINSIDDIELGMIDLKKGSYMLGYLVSDVNQNDEFYLNEGVFIVR
jgi:Clostripain family